MMKALVVDDDRVLADVITFILRCEGFRVIRVYDGEAALQCWAEQQPDLIVLDINLPKVDGFTVCQRIREQADTPILLLSVRNEEDDIVHGLEVGADDYITKPFSPRQLIARAQAVLRRAGPTAASTTQQVGDLNLDAVRREMCFGHGQAIPLTPQESRLLNYLMLNAGHFVPTEAIIEHMWGPEGGDFNMLRQLIHRLRHKLSQACQTCSDAATLTSPDYIENLPGLGYGLMIPPHSN